MESANIGLNSHIVWRQVFFHFMDDHFVKGFLVFLELSIIVLCCFLAFLNNLPNFAADAIGLDQDFVADLGGDVVFMKYHIFYF